MTRPRTIGSDAGTLVFWGSECTDCGNATPRLDALRPVPERGPHGGPVETPGHRLPVTCPHCGSTVAPDPVGELDVCTACGALSRDGQPLRREQPFRNFALPKLVDLNYIPAAGVHVAAVMMEDGGTGIAVTYALAATERRRN